MVFFLVLVLLLVLPSFIFSHPVCVIGGGITGLVIASKLQFLGYDVELYEATQRFGGKLDTYRENGAILEKGPIFFTEYEIFTNAWRTSFGMTTIPYNVTDHVLLLPLGIVAPLNPPFPGSNQQQRLIQLTNLYKTEWSKYPAYIWNDFGYSTVDFNLFPDLADPIDDWLVKRGLTELRKYFIWFITIEGYGDIRTTPALYALKLISAENAHFFFELGQPLLTFRDGFDEFANRIANVIHKKYTGWEVVNVNRYPHGQNQTVTFNVNRVTSQTRTCARTILAFPPLYSTTRGFITPTTTQEDYILSAVRVKKFAACGLNIPSRNFKDKIYIVVQPKQLFKDFIPQWKYPEGKGGLLALTRQEKDGSYSHFTGYSWITGDFAQGAGPLDLEIMKRKIDDLMQWVDPNYKLLFLKATDYFPQVPKAALLKNFYKGMAEIQGRGGIFWASTLLSFESVNFAIETAERMVALFFPGHVG